MILIQRIETHWTKVSRGMPNAGKRSAVPRGVELPGILENSKTIYIHEVIAHEDREFELVQDVFELEQDEYWSLKIVRNTSSINVLFTYDYWEHGKPSRGTNKRRLFELNNGELGRFLINGRFASYSGQYYKQNIVNIANTSDSDKSVFINGTYAKFTDELVNLF